MQLLGRGVNFGRCKAVLLGAVVDDLGRIAAVAQRTIHQRDQFAFELALEFLTREALVFQLAEKRGLEVLHRVVIVGMLGAEVLLGLGHVPRQLGEVLLLLLGPGLLLGFPAVALQHSLGDGLDAAQVANRVLVVFPQVGDQVVQRIGLLTRLAFSLQGRQAALKLPTTRALSSGLSGLVVGDALPILLRFGGGVGGLFISLVGFSLNAGFFEVQVFSLGGVVVSVSGVTHLGCSAPVPAG